LAAWMLPLIVAAIAVSIIGGFYLGGPGLGMAVGALNAATIIVMAVRHPPLRPIVPVPARDLRRRILVVLSTPLEDTEAVETVAGAARPTDSDSLQPEVLVMAPCRNAFLDRWTSDVGPGRDRAQRDLVLSVASLAKAEIEASALVGDEDLVRMVEDQLQSFPATDVILVTGSPKCDTRGHVAARDLQTRLQVRLRHLSACAPGPATWRRDRPRGGRPSGRAG
jgi:hypothetical protein